MNDAVPLPGSVGAEVLPAQHVGNDRYPPIAARGSPRRDVRFEKAAMLV
jgi:hypothetical protein